jgi:hypothetical protein
MGNGEARTGRDSHSTYEAAKRWVRRRSSFPATAMAGNGGSVFATAIVDGGWGKAACLNILAASSMIHPVDRRRNAARDEAMERRYDT